MRRRQRSSHSLILPSLSLSVLIIFVLVSLLAWCRLSLQPVSKTTTETVIFVVPPGQPTDLILQNLEKEKLIRSAAVAKLYLLLSGNQGTLQAGSFRLSPSFSVEKIIQTLQHGTLDVWITIPEGWRAEQIVDELLRGGLLNEDQRLNLYQEFHQHEGRLFPDSYLLAHDSSPQQIITKMTATFEQKTANLSPDSSALIIASLVEREAKRDEDRPLIASVIKNRLEINVALQIDATLQFAKASAACSTCGAADLDWWPQVNSVDKSLDSPYNTYLYPGFPPGPIANPGLASIEAALEPATTDFLYYVSEADGTTHYASTLEEHQQNIRQYL